MSLTRFFHFFIQCREFVVTMRVWLRRTSIPLSRRIANSLSRPTSCPPSPRGHHKSFQGWYISTEISRKTKGCIETFHTMGKMCKDVSGGLPTFISPWIDGKKAVMGMDANLKQGVSVREHEQEWDEIFDGIHDVVDACAFQDGHIDYDELDAFFTVNKRLADKYGMQCWTNAESFDRDMPIRFLPIKFDKLRMKLEAAARCGYDKAITFEFSHFMSPQSAYLQAGHLYDRYKEYFGI